MTHWTLMPMLQNAVVSRGTMVVLALGLFLSTPGCSSGPKRPATVKVSGKVTMNGTPVPRATVSFQPTAPGGRAAVGITDDAGQYALTTFTAGDGAVAGDYGVAIVKMEEGAAAGAGTANTDQYIPPEGMKEPPPAKSLIPTRFNNPRESGLRASVGSGSDTFNFELSK
ncbi:MAG: carboxypeptidase regulatory-like domain-containing protein [Actinobacteria bacterium]|nr:carboxypeptidase regulatory-like domain-containing protein [Actinomycetota bacterium]